MAPEVVEGQPSDFKADVWILGVILYHLASTKLPFSGQEREETRALILEKILSFGGPEWSDVHP